MKKVLLKHKKEIILLIVLGIFLIPCIIHVIFIIPAPLKFLDASWEAGDVLSFYGVLIGAVATVFGVYVSVDAAQENYRKDVINRSLPFMSVTKLHVRTDQDQDISSKFDIQFFSSETGRKFEEYVISKLYYIIKNGNVEIFSNLTETQKELINNNGFVKVPVKNGVCVKTLKLIYLPFEIENVGNGSATVFSVGINNVSVPTDKRMFSLAQTLKVGQKFHVAIYCENPDSKNYGEYDVCISYYDILGNGYEQNYKFEISEDKENRVSSRLIMDGTQKQVDICK